jgi:hypothetical protein
MHSYSLIGRSRRPCLHPTQQQHSTGFHSRPLLQRERNASKISSAIPARSNPQARQPIPEMDPEPANHTNYGAASGAGARGDEVGVGVGVWDLKRGDGGVVETVGSVKCRRWRRQRRSEEEWGLRQRALSTEDYGEWK